MNIPVLLEPIPTGFRASTGAPFNLTAETTTVDEAVKIIRSQLALKIAAGCRIIDVGESLSALARAGDRLATDPQFDLFADAMAEYRKERETDDAEPGNNGTENLPLPCAAESPQ